jgi:hypothetical protein
MIKLKDLLKEELFGTTKNGIEIYRNPKSIKRMHAWLKAVSLPNGDLFVADVANFIHLDIHVYLRGEGINLPKMYSYDDIEIAINKGYINWQRRETSNNFYLSESTRALQDSKDITIKNVKKYSKIVKAKNYQYNFILKKIYND